MNGWMDLRLAVGGGSGYSDIRCGRVKHGAQ